MKVPLPFVIPIDKGIQSFLNAAKQNLDIITGQHKNAETLSELPENATMDDIRKAVNIIIRRLG